MLEHTLVLGAGHVGGMVAVCKLLLELLALVLHLFCEALPQDDHICTFAVYLLHAGLEILYADLCVLETLSKTIALGGSGIEGVLLIGQRSFDYEGVSTEQRECVVRATYRQPRIARA